MKRIWWSVLIAQWATMLGTFWAVHKHYSALVLGLAALGLAFLVVELILVIVGFTVDFLNLRRRG